MLVASLTTNNKIAKTGQKLNFKYAHFKSWIIKVKTYNFCNIFAAAKQKNTLQLPSFVRPITKLDFASATDEKQQKTPSK